MSTLASSRLHLADLGPIAQLRTGRLARRLLQLYAGLLLYGFSIALMVRADLGLAPWDVLHSGLTHWFPIDIGQALVIVSFVVMLGWIPLHEKPGVGTVSNALLIGFSTDAFLGVTPAVHGLPVRVALLVSGVLLQGVATAAYIGAQLGRGPRDGLMTGLARRTGRSLRSIRTLMELTVVAIGLALGGLAGLGTIVYALSICPLSQALLPALIVPADSAPDRPRPVAPERDTGKFFGSGSVAQVTDRSSLPEGSGDCQKSAP